MMEVKEQYIKQLREYRLEPPIELEEKLTELYILRTSAPSEELMNSFRKFFDYRVSVPENQTFTILQHFSRTYTRKSAAVKPVRKPAAVSVY